MAALQVFEQLRPKTAEQQMASHFSILQQLALVAAVGRPLTAAESSLFLAAANGATVTEGDMARIGRACGLMQACELESLPELPALDVEGEADPPAASLPPNRALDQLLSPPQQQAAAQGEEPAGAEQGQLPADVWTAAAAGGGSVSSTSAGSGAPCGSTGHHSGCWRRRATAWLRAQQWQHGAAGLHSG